MSKQARPNWLQARPRQNDLKELWMGGYAMALVTTFEPDMDVSDDSTAVFGFSGTIDTKIINAGTLSMTGILDDTMQVAFDVATNTDPGSTVLRGNYPQSVYLDIVRLTKDPTKRFYEMVELFPKVNFVVTPSGGGPKDKPSISFNGRCDVPIGFKCASGKGVAITTDVIKLAVDASGNLTGAFADHQPVAIPATQGYENSGKYALLLEVQRRTTDVTAAPQVIEKFAYVPVTASNVVTGSGDKGAVCITSNDLLGTGIRTSDVSGGTFLLAFVTYLQETEPAGNTDRFLLGDGVNVRGRFDVPG